jgi:hypothetical protein
MKSSHRKSIEIICFLGKLGKLSKLSSHGLDIPLTLTCGFINVAALGKSKSCKVISTIAHSTKHGGTREGPTPFHVQSFDQDWFMIHDIP